MFENQYRSHYVFLPQFEKLFSLNTTAANLWLSDSSNEGAPKILLVVRTFNNHLFPEDSFVRFSVFFGGCSSSPAPACIICQYTNRASWKSGKVNIYGAIAQDFGGTWRASDFTLSKKSLSDPLPSLANVFCVMVLYRPDLGLLNNLWHIVAA